MYKTYNNWLFDGSRTSPIPKPRSTEDGKVIVPDILKYNSPITHTYAIKLFMHNPKLNFYLNDVFNNIGLRYLEKEELFYFLKKCVIDFRISRRSLYWTKYNNKTTLFNTLRKTNPTLKNDDIDLLCDIINKSENSENIYVAIGLDKPKKKKLKTKKKQKKSKISLQDFLELNFSIMEMNT